MAAAARTSSWRMPRSMSQAGHAHLIGIGGAGMRALADLLIGSGWSISGSDAAPMQTLAPFTPQIRALHGHDADFVPADADMVIHTLAVDEDNPERQQAAVMDVPIYSYPQMLGRLMAGRYGMAVAGTHGKSTATAMVSQILVTAGHDPSVMFGASPLGSHSGGRAGKGKVLLVEACEFRRSFLQLRPQIAAVLGVEVDHFDCFHSLTEVKDAFGQFVRRVPPTGLVVHNADCRNTQSVLQGINCRRSSFGMSRGADWRAGELRSKRGRFAFRLEHHGRAICDVTLKVPGKHNVMNSLAAAAMVSELGVTGEQIAACLSEFKGLHRRLETLGTYGGVTFVDDYAHHPTEVAASLETLRKMFPDRRIVCVFQPHQASRTERLLDEFVASLQNADKLYVADIFRAREASTAPAVTAADVARALQVVGCQVADAHDSDDIIAALETDLTAGDVLVTMGAGDIRKVCDGVQQRLGTIRAAG